MSKVINWGIIGAGKIAEKFAQDMTHVQNGHLRAIASRHLDKAKDFAQRHKIDVSYGTYEDLVKDVTIDAIYIATPHSFHKQHSIMALNHKKAVLCEKPLAMNLKDAEDMIAAAEANNTFLMEALWTAFLPHFNAVENLIESNHFGQVKTLEADFGFYSKFDDTSRLFNKALGGGSLLDIGIYPVFLALSTLGTPDHIEAEADFFDNGTDAQCDITFYYDKGAKAHLKSTFLENTPTTALFKCEQGDIEMRSRFYEPSSLILKPHKGQEEELNFNVTSLGYMYEIKHVNHILRNKGKESPVMSFDRSRILMTTLDAISTCIIKK